MSADKMNEEAMALLTDEERAAIEDGLSPEEQAALKSIAGDDDDDDGGDDGGDGDEDKDEGGKGAAPIEGKPEGAAADAKAGDDAGSDAGDGDEPRQGFRPRYDASLPDDFNTQVAELNEEQQDLAKQFKDGDLDLEEYQTKLGDLNNKRDSLTRAQTKAEISAEMNHQTAAQEWEFTVKSFVGKVAKAEKIDYATDAGKQRDLDAFVKVLAGDEENRDKSMEWFLSEAHKLVKVKHGIADKAAANDGDKPDPKKPRKSPLESVPKTLAQVPGSDGPGDVAGEFSDLDSLEGDDLEVAIAKMSPAQRERFSKAA